MSQQGIQRAQQLLSVLQQQMLSIAQVDDMGGDVFAFVAGMVQKSGIPVDNVTASLVSALALIIKPPPAAGTVETT